MADSSTLFLIICSNNKRRGGTAKDNPAFGWANSIGIQRTRELYAAREHVRRLITQDSEVRDGIMVAKLPRYQNLKAGPDLNGNATDGKYLPAAKRYTGRFYKAIGPDAAELLMNGRHHILILSGLYGLVQPRELIQDYSCHINDHPDIRFTWTGNRLLTNVLLEYIKVHSIDSIIDFTALADYRSLINWKTVAKRMPRLCAKHAFGRQDAGEVLLVPLGELLGQWLRNSSDDQVARIVAGKDNEAPTNSDCIRFVSETEPPGGYPREVVDPFRMTRGDQIVRQARGLKYLLALHENSWEMETPGPMIDRLGEQRLIGADTAAAMHRIINRRNSVEHDAATLITDELLAAQLKDYTLVREWAEQQKLLARLPSEYQ